MPRNIEVKAQGVDLEAARVVVAPRATADRVIEDQIDRYHAVSAHGGERIKVRTRSNGPTEMIRYRRPESDGVRPSDYTVDVLGDGSLAEQVSALGEPIVIVSKRREIFWIENVRVHLDAVEGLGDFLELEAVVDEHHDESTCRRQVDDLLVDLGIESGDLIRASYSDLLLARRGGSS